LSTQAQGTTALFDALAQTASELRRLSGKKVLIAFTDGDDNSSLLSQNAAVNSLKKIGVPVYSIAQGQVLKNNQLMKKLEEISKATGGLIYEIKDSDEVVEAFEEIGKEVRQLYMLGYYPQPESKESTWRRILVELVSPLKFRVRAKEGYQP
jgi:VWFA-related protein